MNYWEFRQEIESAVPAWLPFAAGGFCFLALYSWEWFRFLLEQRRQHKAWLQRMRDREKSGDPERSRGE